MTAEERFEHMVAMALQAWDVSFFDALGLLTVESFVTWKRSERRRFEAAVRERLAQSAQVYEMEIGEASDRGFEQGRLACVETHE